MLDKWFESDEDKWGLRKDAMVKPFNSDLSFTDAHSTGAPCLKTWDSKAVVGSLKTRVRVSLIGNGLLLGKYLTCGIRMLWLNTCNKPK